MSLENRESRSRLPGWLVAILYFGAVALLVTGIALVFPGEPAGVAEPADGTTTTAAQSVDVTAPAGTDEPVAEAAEVILPSVVHIQTRSGIGSGVVYDEGLIITAAHVVGESDSVSVRFNDGQQATGTVVGTAPEVDIAVIEVSRSDVTPAGFNTEKPRVGQMAIAVGSPWGLDSTVTAGIVSAVDQTNCSFDTCSSMVQTDAAINPGNSGGPLVDRAGRVIGINVSIFSQSGANDGVGFAVPADIALAYGDAIVSGEPLQTAFLGVQGQDVTGEGQAGAEIVEVVEGSAAETAGLEVGDVVVGFDGVPIAGWTDLIAQVRAHRPEETVEILFLRDDRQQTVTLTLGVREDDLS